MTPKTTQPHGQGGAAATGANAGGGYSPIISLNRPNSQASNYLLAHALRYALAGWRVLPLQPGGKAPLTAHGVKDASSDPEQIGAWWQQWPAANIGLALGDDVVCFDVDPRNGGQLDALARWLGVDPSDTVTQRTAGGGWHVVYAKPHGWELAGAIPNLAGVDVLTGARYIVAAPSEVGGRRYAWQLDPLDVDPARVPLDVAERLRRRPPAAPQAAQSGPTAAQSASPGRYDLTDLRAMLAVLDPWQDGYSWWLSILMAAHSGFGDDALPLVDAWADGKPGEVAAKWATFDVAGGVSVGTLVHYARLAGWQPAQPEPLEDVPEHWRITPDDWQACPACAALYTETMSDGSVSSHHKWCRRPTCPVYRKVKARQALAVIFSWPAVQTETVPAAAWRTWRKHANRLHGDNWRAVPLAGGDRLALWSVDSGGVPVDDVLHVAVGAILESEQARRAHRGKVAEAKAFLDALPLDEELDPATWQKMQDALDLVASGKPGGNVSRPRRKRTDPAQEAQPPAPRAQPVDTIMVCSMRQQRAIFDVLNRLAIPWERRQYGGWRTDPLTPDQLVQLKTALAFGVPGARVPSGALVAGSYAELSTPQPEPPTGKVYLTAPQALLDAHKHGRKAPRLERIALE